MARITDEMLMAYADGALGKDEAEAVERALSEGDAEARKAVEAFRRSALLVRTAFADDGREPVPSALVDMVLGKDAKPTAKASVLRLRPKRFDRFAMAMAASLAAVALVGGLTLALRPSPTAVTAGQFEVGPVEPRSQLANVLATIPSSVPVDTGAKGIEGAQLMIVGTFLDKSGRICREVEVMDSSLSPQQVAVACRAEDRESWTIEGVARIAKAPDPSPHDPRYAPAGASETDALKGLHLMLGAKEPLSADEELSLIKDGWRR